MANYNHDCVIKYVLPIAEPPGLHQLTSWSGSGVSGFLMLLPAYAIPCWSSHEEEKGRWRREVQEGGEEVKSWGREEVEM